MRYQKWHCVCDACGEEKDPYDLKIMNVNCGKTSVRVSLSLQVWQPEQMVAETSDVCEDCFRKVIEHVNNLIFESDYEKIGNEGLNFWDQALLKASWRNDLNDAKTALLHGADVDAKTRYGHTALSIALKKGYSEIVEILKEAGAV